MPTGTEVRDPVDEALSEVDQPTADPTTDRVDDERELVRTLLSRGRRRLSDGGITLDEATEDGLRRQIVSDFNEAVSTNAAFKNEHLRYVKAWRAPIEPRDVPFKDAANIIVPLTSSICEVLKCTWWKALFGGDRIAEFTTLDEAIDREQLEELNDWFHWELTQIVQLAMGMRPVLHNTAVDGFSLVIASYETTIRRLTSTRELDLADGKSLIEQMGDAIESLFPDESPIVTGAPARGVFHVQHLLRGRKAKALVKYSLEGPEGDQLVAEIERDEVTFDGVKLATIELDDLVVVNQDPTVEGLPFLGVREWLPDHEYLDGVATGKFIDWGKEEVDKIYRSARDKMGSLIEHRTADMIDALEGTNTTGGTADLGPGRRWIEVYRWESTWQFGEQSDAIGVCVWLAPMANKIIRIARLEDLNKDGERTPVKFGMIQQPARFYDIGAPEWIQHIQAEVDAVHNNALNAGMLKAAPFGFFVPGSIADAKNVLKLERGMMYPMRVPNGVMFPPLNGDSNWSFEQDSLLRKLAQEQIGIGEAQTGTFTSKRTSATEFERTSGSMDLRMEYIVEGLLSSLRRLLTRIFGLYQQHMPDGRVFQVRGAEGEILVKKMKRDRLHGKMLLQLTGNIQQLSAQLERDVSLNMLSLLMNDVLIQGGIVGMDTIYAALKRVCRASNYKGVPIHQPNVPPMSDEPELEHRKMLLGQKVDPSPSENFQAHMAKHMLIAGDPNAARMYGPAFIQALQQHMQATAAMEQSVKLLKAQQAAQAMQMQNNMAAQGVRPGLPGGQQAGNNASPGTVAEGVQGAPQ